MHEQFLHYLWKTKKIATASLRTIDNETVKIIDIGIHNQNQGPDFLNAEIEIDNKRWFGHVEIHIYASDWNKHKHQFDKNYNNVILHVVYNNDLCIYSNQNTRLPTIELKQLIKEQIKKWSQFNHQHFTFIRCENHIQDIPVIYIQNELEKQFVNRIERKKEFVKELFYQSEKDWNKTLIKLIAIYLSSSLNKELFLDIIDRLPFNLIYKYKHQNLKIEALLFGLGGFLNQNIEHKYFKELQWEFQYLNHLHQLKPPSSIQAKYFRLRPASFPDKRLSQLASIITSSINWKNEILTKHRAKDIIQLLSNNESNEYWKTHSRFGLISKNNSKLVGNQISRNIYINAFLPFMIFYSEYFNKDAATDQLSDLYFDIPPEQNWITKEFFHLGIGPRTCFDSQALIELYNNLCTQNKCLQCSVFNTILHQKKERTTSKSE